MIASPPVQPLHVRGEPAPLSGGPLALLRFARRNGMLNRRYARSAPAASWWKARLRGRLQLDGPASSARASLRDRRGATLRLGRWSWIGHGSKIRVHEGEARIGAKSVLGQECTISAFQRISIGRECIIADRVMLIDFDHGVVEVDRPIRAQGIYKRDVRVGHNVWVGYGVHPAGGDGRRQRVAGHVHGRLEGRAGERRRRGVPVRILRMRKAPHACGGSDRAQW